MALRQRPHTVTVHAGATSPGLHGIERAKNFAAQGTTVRGMINGKTPGSMLMQFGIECKDPAVLLIDDTDAPSFEKGHLVVHGARQYVVMARPLVRDSAGATNHAIVLLERLERAAR